jgi:recombinational DNA repair protein (RecF pathway)
MNPHPEEWEGLVLAKDQRGEQLFHLRLLTPVDGIRSALVRTARNSPNAQRPPDLWDFISLLDQPNRKGTGIFATVIELKGHHRPIAQRYEALKEASQWSRFLLKHLPEGTHGEAAFTLTRKALGAWCRPVDPVLVHFKALYLYAQTEGFPVREAWLPTLHPTLQTRTIDLLKSKPEELEKNPESPARIPLNNLQIWLEKETGGLFQFPEGQVSLS